MLGYIELTRKELEYRWVNMPYFENSSEISPYNSIIGQEEAIKTIKFALDMNKKGYNLFITNVDDRVNRNYVINEIIEYAKGQKTPLDWCYGYNFLESNKPCIISLKAGSSYKFKNDLEGLVNDLFDKLPEMFSEEEYEISRNGIMEKYQSEILEFAAMLHEAAKEKSFNVKSTREGFAFIPIRNDKEMSETEYNELCPEERKKINAAVKDLKIDALDVLRKTKILKKNMEIELNRLDECLCNRALEKHFMEFKEQYSYSKEAIDYLEALKKDVIENIDAFIEGESQEEKYDDAFYKRYLVNVMIYNGNVLGAPVVYEEYPEYHNLIGIVEYENKSGNLVTDFTMIEPGSLHRANGGYLIVDAKQLLLSLHGYEALKKALKSDSIIIENLKNQYELIPISALRPEAIPLNTKVILFGNDHIYSILQSIDREFSELFKIKVEFNSEFRNYDDGAMKICGAINLYCSENKIPPISQAGLVELLKYSSKIAEDKRYFTADINQLFSVIDEAAILNQNHKEVIDAKTIKETIEARDKRSGLLKNKIINMYRDGIYFIKTIGYEIGQINGLAVIDLGDSKLGKQNRITVNTFPGKNGIVNIEREANMSGNIHSKGIMILSSFINKLFGNREFITFNASICFEQVYGEIDGDSASAAELIALISSLGDIPLKQGIAVTGSVNQVGEIQPVGGVVEKIEGYYDICNVFGLNGDQGVIIPQSNINNVILREDILDSVEKGSFKLYAVEKIEDCFDILCSSDYKSNNRKKVFELVRESIDSKLEFYKNILCEKPTKK